MPRKVQSRAINGFTYNVTPLGASDGLTILAIVGRIIGPGLESVTSFEDAQSYVMSALGQIAHHLVSNDLLTVSMALARSTEVVYPDKRQPWLHDVFDEHFAGAYDDLFSWLSFALEVNFAGFFRSAVQKAASLEASRRKAASDSSRSQSPPASNGPSTE